MYFTYKLNFVNFVEKQQTKREALKLVRQFHFSIWQEKEKSHFSSLTMRPRGGMASGKASYAQTDRRVVHICSNSGL